eukprot:6763185-Pyramimonas_sp.AAC.1
MRHKAPRGLDPKSEKHWSTCKLRLSGDSCFRCGYLSRRFRWQSRLLIDKDQPELGSWLTGRTKNDSFGLGCAICNIGDRDQRIIVRVGNAECVADRFFFRRHEQSKSHGRALAQFLGRPAPKERLGSPPEDAFESALQMTKAARATGKGFKDVGGRQKIANI